MAKLLADAGYRCGNPQCPHDLTVEVHHIEEVSEGGGNEPANLLPLCPYCHEKYHKGWIPRDAIQQWKKRLNERNSPLDPVLAAQVVAEVDKAQMDKPDGFASAAAEFAARTCKIGAEKDGRVIFTGYGTFIGKGLMLTADTVVENVRELVRRAGGRAIVWSNVGLADFSSFSNSPVSHAVVIKVADFDTSYAQEQARKLKVPMEFAFPTPLQTEVKARHMPAIGESVGFLHSPSPSEAFRWTGSLQFERLDVAYRPLFHDSKNMLDFALSQLPLRLEHAGSAVFNQRGVLLGVIIDVSITDPEVYPRPIVAGLLKLDPFNFGEGSKTGPNHS